MSAKVKCKLCRAGVTKKELPTHIEFHINEYYEEEVKAFQKTQTAAHYLKEVTNG